MSFVLLKSEKTSTLNVSVGATGERTTFDLGWLAESGRTATRAANAVSPDNVNVYGRGYLTDSTYGSAGLVAFYGRGYSAEVFGALEPFAFVGEGVIYEAGASPRLVDVRGHAYPDSCRAWSFVGTGEAATTGTSDWASQFIANGILETKRPLRNTPRSRHRPPSRAFHAFEELTGWLQITKAELAAIIGVGRTTPFSSWMKGANPRPAHARRLYELHALVSTLHRRLGDSGLSGWLQRGSPAPLERLLAGDFDAFELAANDVIFPRPDGIPERLDALAPPPEGEAEPPSRHGSPVKRGKRVRSRRVAQ
jgi:hypothetical protein